VRYVLIEAEDGEQACQSYDSVQPDCVLLDYNIPGTDTLELLDRFRQRTPVVMLTGQGDIGAAVDVMKAGAHDYVNKHDFSAETLDLAIQRSIEKAGRQRKQSASRQRLRSEYRSEKSRRRQLEAAVEIARDIQQNLIPDAPLNAEGFDVYGVCLPVEGAAADFFDYFPMAEQTLGLAIGDVSGHGIGPALLTAETRAYLRALSRADSDVGEIATSVNRLLFEDVIGGRFATLFFARLDGTSRTLTYAAAGHPGYLIRRPGDWIRLESESPPLGLFEETVVRCSQPIPLEPDDIVLLATDGLFEMRAPDGEFLGTDRCMRLIHDHRGNSVEQLVEDILQTTRTFTGGRLPVDDLTIVLVKVK
jgi:sigma-B regulation protein RsbU (phosphoserine phosphatase)